MKLRAQWSASEADRVRGGGAQHVARGGVHFSAEPVGVRAELGAAAEKLSAWNDRVEGMNTTDRAAWKREAVHAAGSVSLVASRA